MTKAFSDRTVRVLRALHYLHNYSIPQLAALIKADRGTVRHAVLGQGAYK